MDAQLFSLANQREVSNERRIQALENQVTELTTLLRQLLPALPKTQSR